MNSGPFVNFKTQKVEQKHEKHPRNVLEFTPIDIQKF